MPLQQSIRYANVAISLLNEEGQSYIYGYVPIVVAKCGVFLKEKGQCIVIGNSFRGTELTWVIATDVEGIFRIGGSEKRIRELKIAFDSPDRYGKGLDWTGYTVHDAANILRRYFNKLPEPIIPLDFYDPFRDPLRNHQAQAVGAIEAQSPSVGHFDPDAAIKRYQSLITELPPLNRQLLLYILDLLAVFASKSDLNKMTTGNLAAIFQPGILSHPQHDMAPAEYRLSQDVLIFLIENQDSFLIGMTGTAADAETVREVQSGPSKSPGSPNTPTRSKTIIGRTSSNASTGADSVRQFGIVRRNLSVSSSKNSSRRSENGPTPVGGGMNSPSTPTGSVHRSNTVPSRRGGSATASPRFSNQKHSDPSTPNAGTPPAITEALTKPRQESLQSTPIASTAPTFPSAPQVTSASSSEFNTPLVPVRSNASSTIPREQPVPTPNTSPPFVAVAPMGSATTTIEQSGSEPTLQPPVTSRPFMDIFKPSPTSDTEDRKPRKLQKRRIPGTSMSSAQSSDLSLQGEGNRSPISPTIAATILSEVPTEVANDSSPYVQTTPATLQAPQPTPPRNRIRPSVSPSHSYHSTTDASDVDFGGDDLPKDEQTEQPDQERKRHRWRFSRSQNKLEQPSPQQNALGTMPPRDQTGSRSTMSSNTPMQPRKSFQEPTPVTPSAIDAAMGGPTPAMTFSSSSTEPVFSDSEREKKSGPMSWIRGKMRDRKDKDEEKRAKTPERGREPPPSRHDLQPPVEAMPARGPSFEQQRTLSAVPAPVSVTPAPAPTPVGVVAPPAPVDLPAAPPEARSADASIIVVPEDPSTPMASQEPVASDPTTSTIAPASEEPPAPKTLETTVKPSPVVAPVSDDDRDSFHTSFSGRKISD